MLPRVVGLVVLAFSSCCLYWPEAASATVKCVGSSGPASCQRVDNDCVEVAASDVAEDAAGVPCIREANVCTSTSENDGSGIHLNGNIYSIDGLPNFREDGSHIGYCPSTPNPDIESNDGWNSGGCTDPNHIAPYSVNNLSVSYEPVDTYHYNLVVSWIHLAKFHAQREESQAFRLYVQAPEIPYPGYCICINATLELTNHSLKVMYPQPPSTQDISVSMVTFPNAYEPSDGFPDIGPYRILDSVSPPANCSDYKSGLSYDSSRCAEPYLGKPRNVTMNKNRTHTTLSWDRPCYPDPNACNLLKNSTSSAPETYYLVTTMGNNISNYFIIHNTTKVVLSTTDLGGFKLYTQTPCSGVCEDQHFANGCSDPVTHPGTVDEGTCCESTPTTAATTTTNTAATTTASTQEPTARVEVNDTKTIMISAALVAVVVLLAAVGVAIMSVIVVYHRCRRNKTDAVTDYPEPLSLSPHPLLAVVVSSPRTNDLESLAIIQSLVGDLSASPHGIESTAYGIDQLRLSPTEWIVERHRDASAVLCVCNKEFFEDWNDLMVSHVDYSPQIVKTLKSLFEGDLQRQGAAGTNNYAVVLMNETGSDFIPSLLKSRPVYRYDQTDEIARFARNEPPYVV